MIYLGPGGTPHGVSGTKDSMKYLAEEGLNAMEVQFVRGARMKESTAKEIGEEAEKYDILLSIHAPYYINLNSEKDETIEKSKERIMKSARLADTMSAWIITVHAGYYSGMSSKEATKIIGDGVVECSEKIKEENLNVKIGLEQMGKEKSWGTLDEIEKVMERTDMAFPVLDFAHYHARFNGALKTEDDFRGLIKRYESIHEGPLLSHFSSIEYTDKGEKEHLNVEEYEPDFRELAPILKEKDYDITVICETPELDRDSLRMKEILDL
ncbi:MAG: TIM barrel protein [Candidatus Thermoplasmatota archaeon]|nr:TIM barrel protein [Candidatus Thermoplasmatota archaeon]